MFALKSKFNYLILIFLKYSQTCVCEQKLQRSFRRKSPILYILVFL